MSTAHRPTEIATQFEACSRHFGELKSLLGMLAASLDQPALAKHADLLNLATLGQYAAADFEKLADFWREECTLGGRNEKA